MTSELPKHRRVYAALRHDILIGKYDANEKFPSEGMPMRRFAVSRITVRQAMTDLKKDGFLEARSGSGTYLSALARHATGMIGLVIPDYSSNDFFHRLGNELVRAGKAAGFDGIATDGKHRFPTMRQPMDQLADTAVATLLERIRNPQLPPRQILLAAKLFG